MIKLNPQQNIDEPLTNEEIDQAAGVLFPFYDADSDVIYVAGKGDGSIRWVCLIGWSQIDFCFAPGISKWQTRSRTSITWTSSPHNKPSAVSVSCRSVDVTRKRTKLPGNLVIIILYCHTEYHSTQTLSSPSYFHCAPYNGGASGGKQKHTVCRCVFDWKVFLFWPLACCFSDFSSCTLTSVSPCHSPCRARFVLFNYITNTTN